MARSSASYLGGAGSAAAYKASWGVIAAQIAAVLSRTSDTGQVNWTTVASDNPTLGRDYEVFSFADPLQATAPIVMRFDYVGGNSPGTTGLYVTVGTSSDGAGNIGGLTIPRHLLTSFYPGAVTRYAYTSNGDGSLFTLAYNLDPAGASTGGAGLLVIDRCRNPDGTPNGQGFMVWRWTSDSATTTAWGGLYNKQFALAAGAQSAVDWNSNLYVPNGWNLQSAFSGANSYAFPVFTYAGPVVGGASQAIMGGFMADFPRDSEINMSLYGQNMRWLSLGTQMPIYALAQSALGTPQLRSTVFCPIIRWD